MDQASTEQASGFEFIDQSSIALDTGKAYVTKEQRRRARIAVMKDYRSKLNRPDRYPKGTSVAGGVRTHTTKFRVPSYRLMHHRKPSTTDSEEADISNESGRHAVPSIPKLLEAVILCVDNPDAQTRALSHYYLQSYWTNSAAVNPNGEWSIFFLADPAMVHAKLSLVAMHLADRTTGEFTPAQIYHRGQALRIINERLAQDSAANTESTIGTITLLASLDNHSEWSMETRDVHMKALASLIEARGGIDSPRVSDALRRVVGWVDLLHGAINQAKPFLRRSATAVKASPEELRAAAGVDLTTPALSSKQRARPMKPLFNVLQQLFLLINIKSIISSRPNRRLRVLFANSLWSLEHEILSLDDNGRGSSYWSQQSALRAFSDAARICSYSNLRLQNSIFIYRKLMERVQVYILPLLEIAKTGNSAMSTEEVSLLLWVLLMGWKSAVLAHQDGYWFSLSAMEIAIQYGLEDWILQDVAASDDGRYLWLGIDDSEKEHLQREMRDQLAMGTSLWT